MVDEPAYGGSFSEAVIGTPRFINPLLTTSDADRDITALVYSGLMRDMPDGSIIPDLAESYSISSDGLTYTFEIKKGAKFQDGKDVTADDVAFTVSQAQNPELKSPEFANWNGVSVKTNGSKEISFTLKEPYAFFLENTTMGILPKHIWASIDAASFPFNQYNVSPVGSGPYMISSLSKDPSGVATKYLLTAFNDFALGRPYIRNINIKIFPSEASALDAFIKGNVDGLANISPESVPDILPGGSRIIKAPFTRVFGLFFNQNQNAIFAEKEVRMALDYIAPRQVIVESVLHGFARPITGPLATPTLEVGAPAISVGAESFAKASALLAKNGWTKSTTTQNFLQKKTKKTVSKLSFSISTADVPELVSSANFLKDAWNALGANVLIKVFNQSDLSQNVIRTRAYDSLLFGMVLGRSPDLYAFWDSSQRNYPGLNVAEYTNAKADKLLEDLRKTTDPKKQKADLSQFLTYVASDTPAVFLYSPDFVYAAPSKIKNITLGPMTVAADRFENVYDWYIETEKVWTIFSNKK